MSKGDRDRTANKEAFDQGWDRVYKTKKKDRKEEAAATLADGYRPNKKASAETIKKIRSDWQTFENAMFADDTET